MSQKTIDNLLEENSNLLAAVRILIDSAKRNGDSTALWHWDKARRDDQKKAVVESIVIASEIDRECMREIIEEREE